MTVLGALFLEPGSVEGHEVAKSSEVGIPRVLHKSGKAGRQQFRQRPLTRPIEGAGQQQRARIVVHAIAVQPIRHRVHGVLKQAGIVAHRQKMVGLHGRCRSNLRRDRRRRARAITVNQWPCRAFSNVVM